MPAISDHEMAAVLAEESRQHRNEFNNSAAIFELHKYITSYKSEVICVLAAYLLFNFKWPVAAFIQYFAFDVHCLGLRLN